MPARSGETPGIVSLAAAPGGTRLFVYLDGPHQLQRLDPRSGRPLASANLRWNPNIGGTVAGLIGKTVWVNDPFSPRAFDARPLRSGPISLVRYETVRVLGGVLWVVRGGRSLRTYCADPTTGALRAALPRDSQLLAVDGGTVYYTDVAPGPPKITIHEAPLDPHCR